MKLTAQEIHAALLELENVLQDFDPADNPNQYELLSKALNKLYQGEEG